METIRTNGFTSKDLFNAGSATPLKEAEGKTLEVKDICVKENAEGQQVGYIKTTDGTVYATISQTVVEQVKTLAEMLPAKVNVISKRSNAGRNYLMLELA